MLSCDSYLLQRVPVLRVPPKTKYGLARFGDHGAGIIKQPDRPHLHRLRCDWITVMVLPLHAHAGNGARLLIGLEKH